MADECEVSEIITKFLVSTCRLPPRARRCDIQAAEICANMVTKHPVGDEEAAFIPLKQEMLLSSTLNRCYRLSVILM